MVDDSVKSSDDIEKYLGLNTLTSIPLLEDEGDTQKKSGIKVPFKKKQSGQKKRRQEKIEAAEEAVPERERSGNGRQKRKSDRQTGTEKTESVGKENGSRKIPETVQEE